MRIGQSLTLTQDRWVRSSDGVVTGVAKGLAEALELDPGLVRLLWVISVLAFGSGLMAYLVLSVCLPREDQIHEAYHGKLLGVCARIAKRLGVEVGLVRVFWALLAMLTFGLTALAYIALHFLMPEQLALVPKRAYRYIKKR